ncbi:MAG TPA: protein-methionine-sulfoxide reductase catalytic subunit MsrP [Thermoflexales bacterium]|nr:protein-methionine-sulfoxide reductase catalytic subunit MsrP [Thermoflexales bacterium]
MIDKPYAKISSSQITPLDVYLSRRKFLKVAAMGAGAAALSACGGSSPAGATPPAAAASTAQAPSPKSPTDELGDKLTAFGDATNYNNFYEFTETKEAVASLAKNFSPNTWSVSVGGLVNKPRVFDLDDLRKLFGQEERVYRLRCVEGWSMVIPWLGFALNKLLAMVEPTSAGKFVRFETSSDPKQFPNMGNRFYPWPYVEGLRMDEAMHDLTFLATGMYGLPLPGQSGAPVRLAVPWKYGFKSAKSIVKIDVVDAMPQSFWMKTGPSEYGFYSNVNPEVPHPRWSQATERRIGELSRRRTTKFNGYEAQVAGLYTGQDLRKDF